MTGLERRIGLCTAKTGRSSLLTSNPKADTGSLSYPGYPKWQNDSTLTAHGISICDGGSRDRCVLDFIRTLASTWRGIDSKNRGQLLRGHARSVYAR
jgi:hypothetical protein